jgi:hypothetical protein
MPTRTLWCNTPATFALVYASTCSSVPSTDAHLSDGSLRIQPLHVIIKTGKEPRLVVDLSRNFNDHLEHEYFSYSCVDDEVEASHLGCWYGKLDLSNCFLSFPLHPSPRKYFCFRLESDLYKLTHMPFGLNTAPRVCTQLLSVLNFALAELGIRNIRYLDDIFLIGASDGDMARHLLLAHSVIRQLGLVATRRKGQPSRCPSSASNSTRSHRPCRALPRAWRS